VYRKYPQRLNVPEVVAQDFLKKATKVHPVSDFHREWFRRMAREVAESLQAVDREAKLEEQQKEAALRKLSAADKRALGLL
jgi:hypothetical protein